MQSIEISTRIVIICGPTSSGKTTMAYRIKNEFNGESIVISHDEVLATINQKQSQEKIDEQFRLAYFNSIKDAYQNKANQLIIIDSVNIRAINLQAFIHLLTLFADVRLEEISIVKLWIPEEINIINALQHYTDKNTDYVLDCTLQQRQIFSGLIGSLWRRYVENEIIVTDYEYNISFRLS